MRHLTHLLVKISAIVALAFAPLTIAAPAQASIPDLPSYEQALEMLSNIVVGAPATSDGYSRAEFPHWRSAGDGCDTRQLILRRDMTEITLRADGCTVGLGTLDDPYTGQLINFQHTNYPEAGAGNSNAVQIDHIIALCDAWKTGAQNWTREMRAIFANDPLNLIAADGPSNGSKGCGNAHEWLPRSAGNPGFDCEYVTAQTAVKNRYGLTMASDERQVIEDILVECIGETGTTEPGVTEPEIDPEAPEPENPEVTPETPEPETPDVEPEIPEVTPETTQPEADPEPAEESPVSEGPSQPVGTLLANTGTDLAPLIVFGSGGLLISMGLIAQLRRRTQ